MRVERPIYGMSQAGRRWQRSLFPYLMSGKTLSGWKLQQCDSDPCVFRQSGWVDTPKGRRHEHLVIGCYVDDLYIAYSHDDKHSLYRRFVTDMAKDWDVEDEGEVRDLLNVEISRSGDDVILRQTSYIDTLVARFLSGNVPTTHQDSCVPAKDDLELVVERACTQRLDPKFTVNRALLTEYQSLVGALLYCSTNTRPDIAYSVSQLCRAMACPTDDTLLAARRVLYYLHRHKDLGLRYNTSKVALDGFSDSNWAVRQSTSGAVFMLANAAISWSSKRQPCVALSSCEAELVAGSEAAKEAVHLGRLTGELGMGSDLPVPLRMDNAAARATAYNPEHHAKVKHIERRHFFIRDMVESLVIEVPYVPTDENIADFFTKPLAAKKFFPMRDRIMGVPGARALA